MRPAYGVAYAVLVILFFAADWRAGLAMIAWLPLAYLVYRFVPWLAGTGGDGC